MAIARNNSDTAWENDDASDTASKSYTSGSGSNRLLAWASIYQSGTWSSGSYNAEALTKDKTEVDPSLGLNKVNVGHRIAPSTGANTLIDIKSDAIGAHFLAGADYTGVKQSSQPDATASGQSSSATSLSYSITTVADDCWIVTSGWATGGSLSATTNVVFFVNDGSRGFGDTDASVGAAGSKTVAVAGASGRFFFASVSYAPALVIITSEEHLSKPVRFPVNMVGGFRPLPI